MNMIEYVIHHDISTLSTSSLRCSSSGIWGHGLLKAFIGGAAFEVQETNHQTDNRSNELAGLFESDLEALHSDLKNPCESWLKSEMISHQRWSNNIAYWSAFPSIKAERAAAQFLAWRQVLWNDTGRADRQMIPSCKASKTLILLRQEQKQHWFHNATSTRFQERMRSSCFWQGA